MKEYRMIKVHRETHQLIKENAVLAQMSIMEYLNKMAKAEKEKRSESKKAIKDLGVEL